MNFVFLELDPTASFFPSLTQSPERISHFLSNVFRRHLFEKLPVDGVFFGKKAFLFPLQIN